MKSREELILENIELERKVMKHKRALHFLIEVKDHKDANGKDDWYEDAQPLAWSLAREALGLTP